MHKGYVLSISNLQKSLISLFFSVDSENYLIFQIWRKTKLTEPNLTWAVSCLELYISRLPPPPPLRIKVLLTILLLVLKN